MNWDILRDHFGYCTYRVQEVKNKIRQTSGGAKIIDQVRKLDIWIKYCENKERTQK